MAKIEDNTEGFLVIKTESLTEVLKLGGVALCDYCNKSDFTGYYIAVLNNWYCEKCYKDWIDKAVRYPENSHIEQRNYLHYSKLLGV